MCPSFLATRDEKDSTRGRARVLQELANGSLVKGFRDKAVHEALDLCLSCKGCSSDCPAGVDMATYKAEVLHQRYKRRLRPPSHYSLGWLPRIARLASRMPRFTNATLRRPAVAGLAKRLGGIDARRELPTFARRTFRSQFTPSQSGTPVLLWVDTFTDHFCPEVGLAAVRVLENAGYAVRITEKPVCCGLTWISTGQLDGARKRLRDTIDVLEPALAQGIPIVGLEPSCTAVLRGDLPELLADDPPFRAGLAGHSHARGIAARHARLGAARPRRRPRCGPAALPSPRRHGMGGRRGVAALGRCAGVGSGWLLRAGGQLRCGAWALRSVGGGGRDGAVAGRAQRPARCGRARRRILVPYPGRTTGACAVSPSRPIDRGGSMSSRRRLGGRIRPAAVSLRPARRDQRARQQTRRGSGRSVDRHTVRPAAGRGARGPSTGDTARGYPPSIGTAGYRGAVAEWIERRLGASVDPATEVAAVVGTKEFVASTPQYLKLRTPDRDTVLYPAISYPTYEMGATLAGCRAIAYHAWTTSPTTTRPARCVSG